MKRLVILCFVLLVFGPAQLAFCQAYPNKPIRVVVPFPAGESIDAIARVVAQPWMAALGQQMIIDNRGGAGGTIGTELVARATADGYTLLWANLGPLSIGPHLYKKLGYDLFKDFAPVSQATSLPFVLFVSPTLPVNSVTELVAYAKARPGQLNFGSTGVGSGLHLIGEVFKSTAGIDIVHVPYKGVAQAMPEIMAGRLQLAFNTIPAFLPHVKAGRLKALVITSNSRFPLLPDVPASPEVGMPTFVSSAWHAVVVPSRTPNEIVRKLHQTLQSTLAAPDLRHQLLSQGAEPVASSPEEFARFLRIEHEKWGRAVKSSGARVD